VKLIPLEGELKKTAAFRRSDITPNDGGNLRKETTWRI
jgi:hypothetical protein